MIILSVLIFLVGGITLLRCSPFLKGRVRAHVRASAPACERILT